MQIDAHGGVREDLKAKEVRILFAQVGEHKKLLLLLFEEVKQVPLGIPNALDSRGGPMEPNLRSAPEGQPGREGAGHGILARNLHRDPRSHSKRPPKGLKEGV